MNALKTNDCDSQKCELAAAAIILQANIKNIIAAYGDSTQTQTFQIDCSTSTDEVEVKQNLCDASKFTLEMLLGINKNEGLYYNYCK